MDQRPVAVVTGANRGIGKETARGIARAGYAVVLACRDVAAGERAREEIAADTGNGDLSVLELDLASAESIRRFVAGFAAKFGRLSVLVNNAGISSSRGGTTVDGYEPIVGTNYIGTYLLTTGLLPLFEPGRDKRIVNLSSVVHRFGRFRIERIGRYRWMRAYSVSKRMILLYTAWLAERLRGEGFRVNAVHPGVVRTSIMFPGGWRDAVIKALLAPLFIEPAEGAAASVMLATAESTGTGEYYSKGRPVPIRLGRRRRRELAELEAFNAGLIKKP
jgi:retinol dehydrogenase-12